MHRSCQLSRRNLLRSASAAAAFSIVPRHVLAQSGQRSPNEKLNVALIGLGWAGRTDVDSLAGENIVALCDCDTTRELDWRKKYPGAQQFVDYRRMLDQMDKSIDAVVVATPDHTHAVLAMAAIKRGKHVYCEKPLAHNIAEVRALMKVARERKVVTQLGNQGHSSESIRRFCEWIWDGAIGQVHTIHACCQVQNSGLARLGEIRQRPPVPPGLDWNLWLGPAMDRPYHPAYLHESWRGWVPFGNGTIGDWTCHVLDPVFWALELGAPRSVVAQAKDYDPKTQGDAFPLGDVITYEFPATEKRGEIKLVWYSGTERMPRPEMLEPGRNPVTIGAVVYGDKGAIMYGSHGAGGVRIIPEEKMKAYRQPEPRIPRLRVSHQQDFAAAIREGRAAGSDFEYGGRLTEIALLGVIALKMPGTKLEWDSGAMKFTNSAEANQHIDPPYRAGWTL